MKKPTMLFTLTNVLLVTLTVYRSTASNLLHIAGVRSHYSYSLAVFFGEVVKVVLCYCIAHHDFKREEESQDDSIAFLTANGEGQEGEEEEEMILSSISSPPPQYQESKGGFALPFLHNPKSIRSSKRVWRETFNKNAWQLLIPASLYVVQNNLCLFAAERLLPSIYQSIWQIRLLPTALLTGVFLKKWPNTHRWGCLFGIAIGVIVMESAELNSPSSSKASQSSLMDQKSLLFGSLALLTASFCSATSVVVLERIFKDEKTNFWVTNLQLSVFSLIPAFTLVIIEFWRADSFMEPIHAFLYSFWPWVAILVQTGSGILAGLVTKYADGVTNSISGVVSIALTALIDQVMREQKAELFYRLMVILGVSAIVSCTWLYSFFPLDSENSLSTPRTSNTSLPQYRSPSPLPTKERRQS